MTSYYGRAGSNLLGGMGYIFTMNDDEVKPKPAKKWIKDPVSGRFIQVTQGGGAQGEDKEKTTKEKQVEKENGTADGSSSASTHHAENVLDKEEVTSSQFAATLDAKVTPPKSSTDSSSTTSSSSHDRVAPVDENDQKVSELKQQLALLQQRMEVLKQEQSAYISADGRSATTSVAPPASPVRKRKVIKKIIRRRKKPPTNGLQESKANDDPANASTQSQSSLSTNSTSVSPSNPPLTRTTATAPVTALPPTATVVTPSTITPKTPAAVIDTAKPSFASNRNKWQAKALAATSSTTTCTAANILPTTPVPREKIKENVVTETEKATAATISTTSNETTYPNSVAQVEEKPPVSATKPLSFVGKAKQTSTTATTSTTKTNTTSVTTNIACPFDESQPTVKAALSYFADLQAVQTGTSSWSTSKDGNTRSTALGSSLSSLASVESNISTSSAPTVTAGLMTTKPRTSMTDRLRYAPLRNISAPKCERKSNTSPTKSIETSSPVNTSTSSTLSSDRKLSAPLMQAIHNSTKVHANSTKEPKERQSSTPHSTNDETASSAYSKATPAWESFENTLNEAINKPSESKHWLDDSDSSESSASSIDEDDRRIVEASASDTATLNNSDPNELLNTITSVRAAPEAPQMVESSESSSDDSDSSNSIVTKPRKVSSENKVVTNQRSTETSRNPIRGKSTLETTDEKSTKSATKSQSSSTRLTKEQEEEKKALKESFARDSSRLAERLAACRQKLEADMEINGSVHQPSSDAAPLRKSALPIASEDLSESSGSFSSFEDISFVDTGTRVVKTFRNESRSDLNKNSSEHSQESQSSSSGAVITEPSPSPLDQIEELTVDSAKKPGTATMASSANNTMKNWLDDSDSNDDSDSEIESNRAIRHEYCDSEIPAREVRKGSTGVGGQIRLSLTKSSREKTQSTLPIPPHSESDSDDSGSSSGSDDRDGDRHRQVRSRGRSPSVTRSTNSVAQEPVQGLLSPGNRKNCASSMTHNAPEISTAGEGASKPPAKAAGDSNTERTLPPMPGLKPLKDARKPKRENPDKDYSSSNSTSDEESGDSPRERTQLTPNPKRRQSPLAISRTKTQDTEVDSSESSSDEELQNTQRKSDPTPPSVIRKASTDTDDSSASSSDSDSDPLPPPVIPKMASDMEESSDSSSDSGSDTMDFHREPWVVEANKEKEAAANGTTAQKAKSEQKTPITEDDSSDESSDSDGEIVDFHRKPWMLNGENSSNTGAYPDTSQKMSEKSVKKPVVVAAATTEEESCSSSSSSSDDDPTFDLHKKPSLFRQKEDSESKSNDSQSVQATETLSVKYHVSVTQREAKQELDSKETSSSGQSKIELLRLQRREQQAQIQKSIGALAGGSTTPPISNVTASLKHSGTEFSPKSQRSTETQPLAENSVTATAKEQHIAREANLALAVLSYLKFNGLEETANSFASEWQKVHGDILRNDSVVMGVIRWEPLLPESFPSFSFPRGKHSTTTTTGYQDATMVHEYDKEKEENSIAQNQRQVKLAVGKQALVTADQDRSAINAEENIQAESVDNGNIFAPSVLAEKVGSIKEEIPRHSARRGVRKSIMRSHSENTGASPRRVMNRSVSFDHLEAKVLHIPRYDDTVKSDCFYNKQDLHQMRFDHQIEKQKEATETLWKFIGMANEHMGVPNTDE